MNATGSLFGSYLIYFKLSLTIEGKKFVVTGERDVPMYLLSHPNQCQILLTSIRSNFSIQKEP